MMLSTGSSSAVEDVIAARRAPIWQQLYATDDWQVTAAIVHRAQKAGCTAITLTVDNMPGRNTETLLRAMRRDDRDCTQCHIGGSHDMVRKAPMFAGLDVSRVKELTPTNMSGNYLKRLRDLVSVKLLVKGIVTGEDATLAMQAGVDGIVVSNHGGRTEETLRPTLECLPEIVTAVRGPCTRAHRRRDPAWHGYFQGPGIGSHGCGDWTPAGVGLGGVWAGGVRSSQRYTQSGAAGHHASGRNARPAINQQRSPGVGRCEQPTLISRALPYGWGVIFSKGDAAR